MISEKLEARAAARQHITKTSYLLAGDTPAFLVAY
jgi:hypothetical protein